MADVSDIDPCYATIAELSHAFATRALSPVEVTRAHLQRIDRLNPVLHPYMTVLADSALDEARQAEEQIARGNHRGRLHGVPIAVKDLCFTQGIPTTAGMAIHRDFRPSYDATVVSRLRRAGAVLLGKLHMCEAAGAEYHPDFPAVVNPWSAERWAGASSSGSAVATVTGLCTASLGGDTGGSIRTPCTMTGATGLKPTWGRVSVHGVFAMAPSLDTIGPMARNAEDTGHVLQAIAGADPQDPTATRVGVPEYVTGSPEVRTVRIGFDPEYALGGVEPDVARVVRTALRVLANLGADIREVSLPSTAALAAGWGAYVGAQITVVHERTYPSRSAEYGPFASQLLDAGHAVSGMEIARIQRERNLFAGRLAALFEDVDLLVAPVLPLANLTLDRFRELLFNPETLPDLLRFTGPFNFSGSPTITLPGGFDSHGGPIGFQFVARHFDEPLLIRAGRAFQSATDWHLRRPPVQ
ncbi:amidase [Mycobacterium ulcerans]|uniref:amidase n=1 Tax=Mycobacterium ulcerans TaxID=1809 RepID=UPI000BBADF62|nr:amidase [Mycobacterium ulcerans]